LVALDESLLLRDVVARLLLLDGACQGSARTCAVERALERIGHPGLQERRVLALDQNDRPLVEIRSDEKHAPGDGVLCVVLAPNLPRPIRGVRDDDTIFVRALDSHIAQRNHLRDGGAHSILPTRERKQSTSFTICITGKGNST